MQRFVRVPDKDEWGPFHRYSPLISKIEDIYSTDIWGVGPSLAVGTYAEIENYLSAKPFPSLRGLFFPQSPDLEGLAKRHLGIMDAMALLSSSALLSFEIAQCISPQSADSNADLVNHYVETLSETAPLLRRFRLSGYLKPSIIRFLGAFKYLESIDLNFSHPTFAFQSLADLNGLAELESLTTLLLSVALLEALPSSPPTSMNGLKKVALSGDLESFRKICLMVPAVEHLVLRVPASMSPAAASSWRTFFHDLPHMCPSVRGLEIRSRLEIEPDNDFRVLDYIKPLFPLPLKTLYIKSSGYPCLRLSDKEVGEIGMAWPNLQHLELFEDARYVSPDIPSAHAIKTLFQLCRDLRTVRMSIMNESVNLRSSITDFQLIDIFKADRYLL
jgi:hypothetical protein